MLKHIGKLSVAGLYVLLGLALSFSVLLAARCYSEVSGTCGKGSDIRIAGQYVRMKLRQAGVSGDAHADGRRVFLSEQYGGSTFQDVLYCHDGWLMEQLAAPGVSILESAGDKVFRCEGLAANLSGGILSYRMDLGNGALAGGHARVYGPGKENP